MTSFTNCHDAVAALAAVHLVGVCPAAAAQYSATVAAGGVLGTTPAGRAPYGSTVTIVTSKGHAPVAVPAVVGHGHHLRLGRRRPDGAPGSCPSRPKVYSSTVPAAEVIGTVPAAAGARPPTARRSPSRSPSAPSRSPCRR